MTELEAKVAAIEENGIVGGGAND